MTITRMRGMLISLAVVAAVLPVTLIGCSGSSSTSPASGTTNPAPAVVITGTSGTAATGPVTLTFTFSQPMSAFPASDVTVTNGSAAASTVKVNANQYTLVVTPAANSAATMQIGVAIGAFTDTAGVANTAAASASQTVNTVVSVTAPTVAISGTSGTAVTGPFTLTYTFSQPMTSFPASDVTVTGATTAAATVRTDATHYSQLITPPSNATGTITINIAAGAFTDTAGTANTAAANASQTYNTVGGTTLSYNVIDFNSTLASGFSYLVSAFNGATGALTSTGVPSGIPNGGPQVVSLTVPASATPNYCGATLSVGGTFSVGSLPFYANPSDTTPTATDVSVVLYAPASGLLIDLKAENANNPNQTVQANQLTTSAGWQTLTFNFANPATGTAALNPAWTYNKISLFPDFGLAPAAAQTFFVGPITFIGASAPLAPPLTVTTAAAPTTGAPAPTLAASSMIMLWDSSNAFTPITVGNWNPNWGQSGSIAPFTAGSATFWLMDLIGYQGLDLAGPDGNATDTHPAPISISGKTTLHISYWTPDGTSFTVVPIDANDTQEANPIASGTLTQNAWTDLNLSFTGAGFDPTTLRQIKFVTSASENIYMDNIYFH